MNQIATSDKNIAIRAGNTAAAWNYETSAWSSFAFTNPVDSVFGIGGDFLALSGNTVAAWNQLTSSWTSTTLLGLPTVIAVGVASPTGDFNRDGRVDAADYVTWRKGLGSTFTQADYGTWREHFGDSFIASPAAGAELPQTESFSVNVPEPSSVILLMIGSAAVALGIQKGGRGNTC